MNYWYINNWPEGDDISKFLDELKNGNSTADNEEPINNNVNTSTNNANTANRWNDDSDNGNAASEKNWDSFVKNRDFEHLIADLYATSLEYAIYDINNDGVLELLLESADERPFYTTWVFAYQGNKTELVFENYGYGQFRYSPKQNAVLVSPENKPSSNAGISSFYQLKGCDFKYVYSVRQNMGESFYSDGQVDKKISNEERMSYFDDAVYFEWKALN